MPDPEPVEPAAVVETHISTLFFVGGRAYKLKKPVRTDFVDFSTREARRRACHREVELNRRLAPDVYLGVADVTGPDGELCDHLVVMRRMPSDRRLATLAAAGAPLRREVAALARTIASFHANAARVDPAPARRDAVGALWEGNFAAVEPHVGPVLPASDVAAARALSREYLAGREPLFEDRIAAGHVRDGHGDLQADDVYLLDDGPRVLDGLEFDDALRHGDTLADAAFLAMDLERLGRRDLADAFWVAYREASGDGFPATLAHHYAAYRAQVRAKVTALRWSQTSGPERDGHAAAARDLLALCRAHLEAGRVVLVLVGGLPGTGKSTVAGAVARAEGWPWLRSDEVRKEQAGLEPRARATSGFGEGLYSPRASEAVYAELRRRAGRLLALGQPVVLDASWTDPSERVRAEALAAEHHAALVALRCELPTELAAARVEARARGGGDPSDATVEVLRAMAARVVPWPAARPLDTSRPPAEVAARARAVIARIRAVPP